MKDNPTKHSFSFFLSFFLSPSFILLSNNVVTCHHFPKNNMKKEILYISILLATHVDYSTFSLFFSWKCRLININLTVVVFFFFSCAPCVTFFCFLYFFHHSFIVGKHASCLCIRIRVEGGRVTWVIGMSGQHIAQSVQYESIQRKLLC